MTVLPYSLTKDVSGVIGWPEEFYWAVFDILIKADGLGMGLAACRTEWFPCRVKTESAYFVFRHTIFRTIQFHKIIEFVKVRDVIEGKPSLAVAGCGLSESTIKRVLEKLSPPHSDLFVKLRLPWSRAQTPMYGLNLPIFLKLIDAWWDAALVVPECDKTEKIDPAIDRNEPMQKGSSLARRADALLKLCIDFSSDYENAFKFLSGRKKPIENVNRFLRSLGKRCPDPSDRGDNEQWFKAEVKKLGIGRKRRRSKKSRAN